MIPIELIYVLVPLAMALSIYAVWNLDNRVYANIVMGGFASSVLWFFLAANVITENVYYSVSNTTGINGTVMMDVPTFWVFVLFGIVMMVYTIVLSIEAIMERNVEDIGDVE